MVKSPTIIIDDKPKQDEPLPKMTADFRSNSEMKFNEFNESAEKEIEEEDEESSEVVD